MGITLLTLVNDSPSARGFQSVFVLVFFHTSQPYKCVQQSCKKSQQNKKNNLPRTVSNPSISLTVLLNIFKDTVPTEISCFLDYGQELALSLLYYFQIGRNHREK